MSVSERRREGYPPEGPRPRSGLGRVARSRSDAPRLPVSFLAGITIFGTFIPDIIGTGGAIVWITDGTITDRLTVTGMNRVSKLVKGSGSTGERALSSGVATS